jgi:hypothetical protein
MGQGSINITDSAVSSSLPPFELTQLFDLVANGTIAHSSRFLFHFLLRPENPGTRIRKTVNG